jgi:glycosyltransferase involved in cell wall biosynthesis
MYDFLTESGGLERLMSNHAKMLKEEGHKVEVLTYYYNKKVLQRTGFNGIKVNNISILKTKSELLNIFLSIFLSAIGISKIKKHKTDLYITYSFPTNFAIRNKKIKKINYMNHYPNFLYLPKNERFLWAKSTKGVKGLIAIIVSSFFRKHLKKLDKKLVSKSNLNFANSNFTKNKLEKIYNKKIIVSYPPVSQIFRSSKKSLTQKYIFVAGRIIPDKKYELLINACSLMKNKLPLYISGEGSKIYIEKLKRLAKKREIDLIFVNNSIEKLIIYYSNATIFAFPTPGEDFGLVPAESLSCGTPVVIWGDGSGPTEQIIDGINGYHSKPYNLKDFARNMDKIIENKIKLKNKRRILISAKKFSYNEVKKKFISEINSKLSFSP